jgi:hypothetical protein
LKIIKTIRAFLLILAGLAIVVHMIIPHDHHLSGPLNGMKEQCPLSQQKPDHHPVFPGHCHAFNDLAAEKFSPVIVKQENQTSFAAVIWYPGYIFPGLHLIQTIPENPGDTLPDIYLPDFALLRAPPAII